jgi:nucleoid-associated protein YgaU
MKLHSLFIVVLVASLFFLGNLIAVAQEEITKEMAEQQIKDLTVQVNELKAKTAQLTKDIDAAKLQIQEKDAALRKCTEELYGLVGATQAEVDAFGAKLTELERKADDLSRLSNQDLIARKGEVTDLEQQGFDLRKSKISLLPMFYDRVQGLQSKIDDLKKTLEAALASLEKFYTVGTWSKDRDCLWNISKKPDIYDNAFMWPKIWQGNRDQIKNPDVIHPKQVLKIPNATSLTPDEKKAARSYWAKKKSAEMPVMKEEPKKQ